MLRKLILTFCLLSVSLAYGRQLPAQDEELLTLEQAIQEALGANPEIRAAHLQAEAAYARVPQAKALDDPMVGVEFYEVPISTLDVNRGMETNYKVQQKIPFPGKRYIRGKTQKFEADAEDEKARGRILDLLLDLKETYYEIYRIDRQLEVTQELKGVYQQLAASTRTGYASGKTFAEPALKALVELNQLGNDQILLEQEKVSHTSHLDALLNRTEHQEIRLDRHLRLPHLTMDEAQLLQQARDNRPELKLSEHAERRDRARLTAARQGLLPDFSLEGMYHQRPNAQDAWTGSVMINLPLWFWQKNRGELHEAKASHRAAQAEREAMEAHTTHEISASYSAVQSSAKALENYRSAILPASKANLKSARLSYQSGKADILTLVDAARVYKQLHLDYYRMESQYGRDVARLERLLGTTLEENHE